LDYTDLTSAGVRVIVNLRRSYSNDFPGGQGTVPPPDKWDRFVANAIQTIRDAKGVYAFTLFNEANNPREWPVEGHQLTADHVVYLYNAIYREVWQYVNYPGCVQTFLDGLDGRFPGAEVYITEYNHLWLEDELFPQNPTIGWEDNATEVLDAAFHVTSKMRQVFALIAYRWSGDGWKLEDKPQLLHKIVDLNK
jgi:hypothetical protein